MVAGAHVAAIRLAPMLPASSSQRKMTTAPPFIYEHPESMSDQAVLGERASRHKVRTPEIEAVIGRRVKALRLAAGMSQTELGEAIGISFQQIQKYERGADRIAVSTLIGLAKAMGIHPSLFFDDAMATPTGDGPDIRAALKGAEGLQRVGDPQIRKRLFALIDELAEPTTHLVGPEQAAQHLVSVDDPKRPAAIFEGHDNAGLGLEMVNDDSNETSDEPAAPALSKRGRAKAQA